LEEYKLNRAEVISLVFIVYFLLQFSLPFGFGSFMNFPSQSVEGMDVDVGLIWQHNFGGIGWDLGKSVVRIRGGGYAFLGTTEIIDRGDDNIWLVRTDEIGTILWQRSYGTNQSESSSEMLVSSLGLFVIVGTTISPIGDYDACLFFIDQNGDVQRNHTIGGPNDDIAHDVVECSNGDFAIAGYSNSYSTDYDFWLVRTDSMGNIRWNQTYSHRLWDYCYALVEVTGGGFALAGYCSEDDNIYFIRTDGDGNLLWAGQFDGGGYDGCYDLIETGEGGFILVGFAGGTSETNGDIWALYISSVGTVEWSQHIGGPDDEVGRSIIECHNDGYTIIGSTTLLHGAIYSADLMIVRISEQGNVLWVKSIGDTGHEQGYGLVQSLNDDFVIIGSTTSNSYGPMDALFVRVLDAPPIIDIEAIYSIGPPNMQFASIGAALAIMVLAITYSFYRRSKRDAYSPLIRHSKKEMLQVAISQGRRKSLPSVLEGFLSCKKCGSDNIKSSLMCWVCGNLLQKCMICKKPLREKTDVVFCPRCGGLAHRPHLIEWVSAHKVCPRCGIVLRLSKIQ
jgi:hypothetical protein